MGLLILKFRFPGLCDDFDQIADRDPLFLAGLGSWTRLIRCDRTDVHIAVLIRAKAAETPSPPPTRGALLSLQPATESERRPLDELPVGR